MMSRNIKLKFGSWLIKVGTNLMGQDIFPSVKQPSLKGLSQRIMADKNIVKVGIINYVKFLDYPESHQQ